MKGIKYFRNLNSLIVFYGPGGGKKLEGAGAEILPSILEICLIEAMIKSLKWKKMY